MKISKHLKRKTKFIKNTQDSQDYELLQENFSARSEKMFQSENDNQSYRDCYMSKRKEDKKLEDILDGKMYNKYYEDRNLPNYKKTKLIDISTEQLNEIDYLYYCYGYDLATNQFITKETNEFEEENCDKCKFNSLCKKIGEQNG